MYVGSEKTINVKLESGKIYYLKGYSPDNRTGDYNSKYVVQKDVADDKTEAQYVNVNTKTSESIGTSDDQDWYKFYSDKTQKISLTSISEDLYSADIYIYDEQGKEILSSFLTTGYKSEKMPSLMRKIIILKYIVHITIQENIILDFLSRMSHAI